MSALGRFLCRLGVHRYEWRSRYEIVGAIELELSEYRCRRRGCETGVAWTIANVEARHVADFNVNVSSYGDPRTIPSRGRCTCRRHGWNPTCVVHAYGAEEVSS